MAEAVAAADSFSLNGKVEMAYFPGREDAFQVTINGERIESVVARMLGFPSEAEFDSALSRGFNPNPDVPSIVREVSEISLSVYVCDCDSF